MCVFVLFTVLASSGIDYDIKLWTPTAREPMEPLDKDEVRRFHFYFHRKAELRFSGFNMNVISMSGGSFALTE